MKVHELMTTDVTTAELGTTLEEIATIMRHEDVGAVPIMDDGELVGIVTDRDIVVRCVAEGGDPGESMAEDILTEGLVTVAPDADVRDAEEMMSRHQIRRLPVVREGRLQGMISLGDIALKAGNRRGHGQVLENVSAGAKQGAGRRAPRTQGTHEQQGIGNHDVREEKQRQQRVVPIRSGEKATGPAHSPRRKSS
jgi:CBS domain-containing protein